MKKLMYWAGYASGWLANARKRATFGYVAGYLSGKFGRK
jgi:hypothetical protein